MPCYICSHCNKCGIYSMKLDLTCKTCGEPIPPGQSVCAKCGTPFIHNMKSGKMAKPKGATDYYTEIDKVLGNSGRPDEEGADKLAAAAASA